MLNHKWFIPVVGHPSAGKSTLIRILTGRHVSVGKKSGTTKKINIIPISTNLAILDFPGFGQIRTKKKSYSEHIQQTIVDYLEDHSNQILVSIVVSDLSNIELVANKLSKKGFIPIDYELTEFLTEISSSSPIVLGNKIDKLKTGENLDNYSKYFKKSIDFFPVSLKNKQNLESFLIHLQIISDNQIGEELKNKFWKYS